MGEVFGGLGALVGGLGELELERGLAFFFAPGADGVDFGLGAVDFGGGSGGVEGVSGEGVGVDVVEAGGVGGEVDVAADGAEGVVEALFFGAVDGLVDFAVVADFGHGDAELFAVGCGDFEFRRLGGFGGVEFAGAVEDGEAAFHDDGEVGAVEAVGG